MTANLSDTQKQYFITMAETSLNDLCSIHHKTGETKNEYNEVEFTYEDIVDVPCGFSQAGTPFKREINQPIILEADAILRLKLTQPLSTDDTITVRNETYSVDNVWIGLVVKIASLKSLDTSDGIE